VRAEKRANKNVKIRLLFSETETAKQNQKFPFHFFFRFAAEGWGEEAREKCKEIFWFLHTRVRERVRGAPKPIIIVEGFLLLHDEKIRKLLDTSIFLDEKHDIRWARRPIRGNSNKEYEDKVIIPMHNQYIEPTKKYADHVIDISNLTKEDVLKEAELIIFAE
jgi:uridine kinase